MAQALTILKSNPKTSVKKLMSLYLTLAGRGDELRKLTRHYQQEEGLRYGAASWSAMYALGYPRKGDEDYVPGKDWLVARLEEKILEEAEEIIRVRGMISGDKEKVYDAFLATYEEHYAVLPEKADYDDEVAWIRSHPAMSRRARTGEEVILNKGDLAGCPSKAAANALQYFANSPEKFYQNEVKARPTREKPDVVPKIESITESEPVAVEEPVDEEELAKAESLESFLEEMR